MLGSEFKYLGYHHYLQEMQKTEVPILTFHDGGKIPQLGLGTYDNNQHGVQSAIQIGYRHLDCAFIYKNQDKVGKGVKDSKISRGDLFITSKIWTTHFTREKARQCLNKILKDLDVQYLDLLLVHWPLPEGEDKDDAEKLKKIRVQVWQTFIDFKKQGKTKHIGVSNFLPKHIDQLLQATGEKPVVNQILNHPYRVLDQVIEYCRKQDILIQAWSPLGQQRHNLLEDKTIKSIGQNYKKTAAQVILRWIIQNGHIAIPKSTNPQRQKENFNIFDFQLSSEDMKTIDNIHKTMKNDVDQNEIERMFVA